MCSGIVSSTIRKCRENLPPLENHYDAEFVNQLSEFLPHAKEIKFYGGEPFLIDTYYQIWDKLLAINSKAKLHVVTNGTVLTDKVRNYLKKLNFTITVSFDALNKELFESIRVGADFDKVKANILEYNHLLGGKGLSLSLTPMKSNCREVPAVIDFCNTMNATINLSFVENPADMALWTMPSIELKELEIFYNAHQFSKHFGVNSDYNIKAFNQFVNQIGIYIDNNRGREDEFFANLKTEEECVEIVNSILNDALKENIIFESDRLLIYNAILDVSEGFSGFERQLYFGNLANFLTARGLESIKSVMVDGLDMFKLTEKLVDFSEMPDIYTKSYSNLQ
jgi:MoaA/NifB/PqqE/SkfB family radical SAM enzyme